MFLRQKLVGVGGDGVGVGEGLEELGGDGSGVGRSLVETIADADDGRTVSELEMMALLVSENEIVLDTAEEEVESTASELVDGIPLLSDGETALVTTEEEVASETYELVATTLLLSEDERALDVEEEDVEDEALWRSLVLLISVEVGTIDGPNEVVLRVTIVEDRLVADDDVTAMEDVERAALVLDADSVDTRPLLDLEDEGDVSLLHFPKLCLQPTAQYADVDPHCARQYYIL